MKKYSFFLSLIFLIFCIIPCHARNGAPWLNLLLLTPDPSARISTFHFNDDTYALYMYFNGNPEITTVTVTDPSGSGIVDEVLYDDGQHNDAGPNDGIFSNHLFDLPGRPDVDDVYIFNYIHNGFSDLSQAHINGIVDSFASLISPSGIIQPVNPTFNWTPPIDTSDIDSQEIIVFRNGADGSINVPSPSTWVWSKKLEPNISSITFNDDGTSKEELILGTNYYWQISTDNSSYGRAWTYQKEFKYGIDNILPTVISTIPPNGATGVGRDLEWVSITFDEEMGFGHSVSTSGFWPRSGDTPAPIWSGDRKTFSISRTNASEQLPAGVNIWFTLNPTGYPNFKDKAGNYLETYSFSFTTESTP